MSWTRGNSVSPDKRDGLKTAPSLTLWGDQSLKNVCTAWVDKYRRQGTEWCCTNWNCWQLAVVSRDDLWVFFDRCLLSCCCLLARLWAFQTRSCGWWDFVALASSDGFLDNRPYDTSASSLSFSSFFFTSGSDDCWVVNGDYPRRHNRQRG